MTVQSPPAPPRPHHLNPFHRIRAMLAPGWPIDRGVIDLLDDLLALTEAADRLPSSPIPLNRMPWARVSLGGVAIPACPCNCRHRRPCGLGDRSLLAAGLDPANLTKSQKVSPAH